MERSQEGEREIKQNIYSGTDVERGNVPIFSLSSVSACEMFLAPFKAVEILIYWHNF